MIRLLKVLIPYLLILLATQSANAQALRASHESSPRAANIAPNASVVVARVNGVSLTQAALDLEIKRIFPAYSMHGGVPKEFEGQIRQKALGNIVDAELVYQEALRRKLQIPALEWQKRLKEIRADYKSDAEFEATMKQYFGSKEAFEKKLRHDMLLDRMWMLEVKSKSAVGATEGREYFQKNRARFVQPESVSLQTISALIPKNATPADIQTARKRIEKVLPMARAAKTYEEFGMLAEKFSEDDWRVMMGDHKFVHRINVPPELASAFSMKAETTSGIIESPSGFVIIRLNKHTPQKQLTFAEVQSSIRASLEKERSKERSKQFYEALRAKAKIEVME